MPCGGRSSSAIATSTRRRRTGTKPASAREYARAACRVTRSSSPRSSIPDAATPSPRPSAVSNDSASTTSICTSSIGRKAVRPGRGQGWKQAHARGLARSIGVSNFDEGELEHVLADASTPPVIDQVQFSPYEYRRGLLEACGRQGIALEAYSPLGRGRHLGTSAVTAIADRLGRTPAQVLLRWCLQHDVPAIPKSTHRERIAENANIFDFSLSTEDMAELDALDETGATSGALERKWWRG